ncbi:hypothetical protein LL946_14425 [Knoellia locipacati]|uniref:prenyltransferase/squalene oxidase repeat-containing protein n=1 Tax=Knoellia locipacati TaxID=882824 RepID=UPI00384F0EBB
MHRTPRRVRVLAPFALAALTLGMPTAAVAETVPAPGPTASASSTPAPPAPSPTSTATPSPSASSSSTTSPSSPATGTPEPTATEPPAMPSTTPSSAAPGGVVEGGDSARLGLRAAAGPATSTDPTLIAAGFLERELIADGHHLKNSGYPDYGLTLDAILALDAAGAGQAEATAAMTYVADHIGEYLGFAWGPNELYAGATAKTLLTAVAQGADPTEVGGVDLVASLKGREQTNGRFTDSTDWTDYSNMIGQSLAVLALDRAGEPVSAAASQFIRTWQCDDGGFALTFAAPCSSDPDATAYAVQALIAVGGTSEAAAQEGLDYLADRQQADGGIGGAGPTAATNSNSTGLAGQAFVAGGRIAQARSAQNYIRSLQFGCAAPVALRGAIAYNAESKAAATAPGDQERRATAQAILALAGTPLFAVSATGADSTAPDLACAAPTTPGTGTSTPTGTTTPTTPAGSGSSSGSATDAPAAGSGGSDGSGTSGGSTASGLAYTGATVALPIAIALLLLLVGGATVLAARRRGLHA